MKVPRLKLLVDVDGVITECGPGGPTYSLGPVVEGARAALHLLSRHFHLVYYTARADHSYVARYLAANGLPTARITSNKESGLVIDDRAITFRGVWNQAFVQHVVEFKPWWGPSGPMPEVPPEDDPEG